MNCQNSFINVIFTCEPRQQRKKVPHKEKSNQGTKFPHILQLGVQLTNRPNFVSLERHLMKWN